jgi:hypothetical protein
VAPGKDLDSLIAEKIMGWKKIELSVPFYGLYWMWGKKEGCLYHDIQECPKYSTDIAAAWQVVDKLKDYMCELEFDFGYENRIWAMFTVAGIIDELHPSFQSEGKSAAHAICLAALLYVGHKV